MAQAMHVIRWWGGSAPPHPPERTPCYWTGEPHAWTQGIRHGPDHACCVPLERPALSVLAAVRLPYHPPSLLLPLLPLKTPNQNPRVCGFNPVFSAPLIPPLHDTLTVPAVIISACMCRQRCGAIVDVLTANPLARLGPRENSTRDCPSLCPAPPPLAAPQPCPSPPTTAAVSTTTPTTGPCRTAWGLTAA